MKAYKAKRTDEKRFCKEFLKLWSMRNGGRSWWWIIPDSYYANKQTGAFYSPRRPFDVIAANAAHTYFWEFKWQMAATRFNIKNMIKPHQLEVAAMLCSLEPVHQFVIGTPDAAFFLTVDDLNGADHIDLREQQPIDWWPKSLQWGQWQAAAAATRQSCA